MNNNSTNAFNLSLFSSVTDKTPASAAAGTLHVGLDWDGVLTVIGQHRPVLSKKHATVFSPCEWQAGHGPNKHEKSKFVIGVHFGSFDFDDLHESDLPKVFSRLEGSGVAHAVLSSFSHSGRRKYADCDYKDKRTGALIPALPGTYYQLRILFPFTRLVLASEWKPFWSAMQTGFFNDLADTLCKSAGNVYYLPCYKEGSAVVPIYISQTGAALDIDVIMKSAALPTKAAETTQEALGRREITAADLRRVARALKGSKSKRELGEALEHVVNGDEFAAKGSRHGIAYRLVREVLDRHPAADHERLAALFGPSLAMMQPTHVDEDVLVGFCEHKPAEGAGIDHTSRIAEAFNGARAEPYGPEDVQSMAEALSCRPDELLRRWIIQKGDNYYVLCDGIYRCYASSDVGSAIIRDLAPAATVGVDLYELTQRGKRRRTMPELMELYGTVAGSVTVDLAAQAASYEPVTRAFTEAPCPIRVTAKYDTDVETWLRIMTGTKSELVENGLACITRLREPLPALYLSGMGGTGKSLLPNGLARIFGKSPVMLGEALGTAFNEALVGCPIVFGDEDVPRDYGGRIRSTVLREFIQARTRPLLRKYRPPATLVGCVRLVLAANGSQFFSELGEELETYDAKAVGDRILYVPVSEAAESHLESLPRGTTRRWIEEDVIARHALWLAENLEFEATGRFLVHDADRTAKAMLSRSGGCRSEVCQWLVGFLREPARTLTRTPDAASVLQVVDDRLLVSSGLLDACWEEYVPKGRTRPSETQISRALGCLSASITVRDPQRLGRNLTLRGVDLDNVAAWAETTQGLERGQLAKLVADLEPVLALRRGAPKP